MNRYLIECINDCKNEFVVAYAPSMYDDNMSKAADDYAYELAVSIVDDEFIVTAEGYDYEYMTDEDVPTEAVYSKIHPCEAQLSPAQLMFKALKSYLEEQKFEIFLVTPECYTIRAKFPEGYKYQGVADFVMARKEVGYVAGL